MVHNITDSIDWHSMCGYIWVYSVFSAASHTAPPAPMAAPVITSHPDSDSGRKLFAANISAALPSRHLAVGSELNNSVSPQNMSYLYKIQKGNDIHYLWQVKK